MFEITGLQQKRCWDEQIMPPVEQVRPGLWSIPVPMPDSSLRYVLVYALELAGDAGVAIVDAGWDTDEAWSALGNGLAQAGFALTDVRGVLVTHIHPDHYGLAGRVREASGAWIALHPADAAVLPTHEEELAEIATTRSAISALSGVPAPSAEESARVAAAMSRLKLPVRPDLLLSDGDRPELPGWDLTAIWTPGHSPGHLCFASAERRLILTGDHVLPRITPSVSVHSQAGTNPLGDYLDSLAKVGVLESELELEEVLPAHEYRFRGLADRVATIAEHHRERLDDIVRLLTAMPGATCWELTAEMRWSRPWVEIPFFMRRAAAGETLAHLVVLVDEGRIRSEGDRPQRWFSTRLDAVA